MERCIQTVREVHDTLLPILAETYGEQLQVRSVQDADTGRVVYRFTQEDVDCVVCTVPTSNRAAAVCFSARLGRCYVGYRRALHWLACNRGGNTVALSACEDTLWARELWVACNRMTLPGDGDGVREQLRDFQHELKRVAVGMAWFPQMLAGAELAALERKASEKEGELLEAVLAAPRSYCKEVTGNPDEAIAGHGAFPMKVYGWLGKWEAQLQFMDRHFNSLSPEDKEANRVGYLKCHCVALCQTKRFAEMLAAINELEALEPDLKASGGLVAGKMRVLCGSKQPEEALEIGQSAEHDGEPRVWFWRGVARAALGEYQLAVNCLMEYEGRIGIDILARQQIRRLLPPDWQPEDPTP